MPASVATKQINVTLPPLHAGTNGSGGQIAIANDTSRFQVVMCGRRWGKTIFGVWKCLRTGLQGGRVWWVAPTYKIANEGWVVIKRLCYQMIEAGVKIEIRESDKQAVFPLGGMIEVRTSDVEGSLRGSGLDGVVFDEAASHRESAWIEEIRPALIDKRGWCLFIGTPKGDNWFNKLFKRGESTAYPNWSSWKRTTWDNPFISPDEKAEIEEEYENHPDKYKQEILADVGASQYLVYPVFDRGIHAWKLFLPEFVAYYGGLDFGGDQIGAHKSAGVLSGETKDGDLIIIEEFEDFGPNITERQITWMSECQAKFVFYHKMHKIRQAPMYWAGDRSQMKFLDVLKMYHFRVTPNKGGTGSVRAGIDLVSARLNYTNIKKPRLYYLHGLKHTPNHFETYHNYEPRDGDVPQHDNPVKVNDDLDDAIRYMVERRDGTAHGNPKDMYPNGILSGIR